MTKTYDRRESLKLMASAAVGAGLSGGGTVLLPGVARGQPARTEHTRAGARERAEDLRGIFVILATPYTTSGDVDYEDLAFQVEWLARAGANGLVWPQNSSDYPGLGEDEIMRGMEVLVQANRGRPTALVLGVQRDSTPEMVELATFAEGLGPDMMIAMPPKVGRSLDDYRSYYEALAGTTSRPVIIQTQPNLPGVEFDTRLILELARDHPHLGYVKEEAQPVFDRISALVGRPGIERVYSAMRGRFFAYDLRLGVDGLVSGMSMYADVFARMWAAYRSGDWDEVRDIHARLLVMLTCEEAIPGAGRYILQRRGIFRTTTQRGREHAFSASQAAEIEHNLDGLSDYMMEVPARA